MSKFFKILIIVAVIGVVWYQFGDLIRARFLPCREPISYTLGTFDTKFGISESYFLSALKDAEAIWEKPFGKELFSYTQNSENKNILKINLVYDYRQEATGKLADLGIVVEENRASYDELKIKLTNLKAEYTKAKNDYEERVQDFNAEQKTYEQKVEYWNARGGAPEKEYKELQAEKSALNREASQLRTLQTEVNQMVDGINAIVVALNRLAGTLNISVDKYNTIGAERGESFEEGVYFSDGLNREIDIYEFSNRTKLVRVLAHELGHALDLDHVEDPKAIMYKLNQGKNVALTDADLEVLKTKCGVE